MKRGKGLLCFFLLLLLCGCGVSSSSKKQETVAFTVVPTEELPQELLELLEKNKEREMRMTYQDGDDLYLIRGYGKQKTGGYSISVKQCSEDEENLYFFTQLIGPESTEKQQEEPSCPYLVAKTEKSEKNIEID